MNKSYLFSDRLKNERLRLGLTQAKIANKCNISREMWGKYERGIALPGSEVLFSLASIDVDVGYLFSGIKSGEEITEAEARLLEDYRESNEQGKDAIERTAKALATTAALENRKVVGQ